MKKKILGGLALLLTTGMFSCKTFETDCLRFRNYSNLQNGLPGPTTFGPDSNIIAYDDNRNEEIVRTMEIGEQYRLKIRSYFFGLGKKEIISHNSCVPQ